MVDEIISKRTETSKTYDLGGRKRRLESYIGAIHYKDNYANSTETWKDIDLTIRDGRITAAPYELTIADKKLTFEDKKTGEVSSIELLSVSPAGIPFEVIPEFSAVRFQHILPSDKVPFEARFKVSGKAPITRAFDDEGELELETSLVDGILTEKLSQVKDRDTGQVRPAKGQIRIDPTWQVGASADDATVYWDNSTSAWVIFALTYGHEIAGRISSTYFKYGSGLRFLNVTIASGSTIDVAYLTLQCSLANSNTIVNSRITGNKEANAATWSTLADYQARRGIVVGGADDTKITKEQVDWDSVAAWALNDINNSPSIVSVIQEIIDQGGWTSGNALAVWWDDHDNRSTQASSIYRAAFSFDNDTTKAPKLVIDYTEAGGLSIPVAMHHFNQMRGN